jgi:hypothetical protein
MATSPLFTSEKPHRRNRCVKGGDFCLVLMGVTQCAGLAAVLVLFLPEHHHPQHQLRAHRPT